MGKGEQFYSYISRLLDKVRIDIFSLDDEYKLSISVGMCNESAGPDGNVPTLLLFGVNLRLQTRPSPLPDNAARRQVLYVVQFEMKRLTAQAIIRVRSGMAMLCFTSMTKYYRFMMNPSESEQGSSFLPVRTTRWKGWITKVVGLLRLLTAPSHIERASTTCLATMTLTHLTRIILQTPKDQKATPSPLWPEIRLAKVFPRHP